MTRPEYRLKAGGGRTLITTPVFDTYWKFAAARQEVYRKRVEGSRGPFTTDPILGAHRFTNAYRASDRVSQFLIREVIYGSDPSSDRDLFFRILLFKIFNKIETWHLLEQGLGHSPNLKSFQLERYCRILDEAMSRRRSVYSAAYIMPSPSFGHQRKHRNHLELLAHMLNQGVDHEVMAAGSLEQAFGVMLRQPSFGDFLAFQFTIDLNYSPLLNFSEMDFVVAGPGAKNGIRKCFRNALEFHPREVIRVMCDVAEGEFGRLGLKFHKLGNKRPLQLIDCQNLFCETDKYARVAHPEFNGESGRKKIKQKFSPAGEIPSPFFPPKWRLSGPRAQRRSVERSAPYQLSLVGA